jgi:putative membrane protein
MIYILSRIALVTFALLLVDYFYSGMTITGLSAAIIAAIVLGVLNAIVRPLLVILTIPITILTLGLFIFVINAGLFALAASFVPGFAVNGFIAALIGSVLVSIVSSIGNRFLR